MAQDPAAAPSPVPIITQLGVAAVGKGIFWMLNSGHEWVHRRSETVEFHDRKTVTRAVTVEFTLPDVIPTLRLASGPVRLVPVTLMDKHNLVHFELQDECGSAVPVLTAEENTVVGTAALVAAAADALSCAPQDVPEELRLQLRGIAGGTRQQRLACLAQREHWDARLERAQAFSLMVDRLAASFPVLVLLGAEPGDRRLLRFCYDEIVNIHELEPDVEALRQRWIGPKAAELAVKVGALSAGPPQRLSFPPPRRWMPRASTSRSRHPMVLISPRQASRLDGVRRRVPTGMTGRRVGPPGCICTSAGPPAAHRVLRGCGCGPVVAAGSRRPASAPSSRRWCCCWAICGSKAPARPFIPARLTPRRSWSPCPECSPRCLHARVSMRWPQPSCSECGRCSSWTRWPRSRRRRCWCLGCPTRW